jgi:alpha-galactosidase
MRSPLIFGGDLPANDAFTLSLLTNQEVIAVDQKSTGNHQIYESANTIAWVADAPDSKDKYVALFNLADKEQEISLTWSELKLPFAKGNARDVWEGKDLGVSEKVDRRVAPHGALLLRVKPG